MTILLAINLALMAIGIGLIYKRNEIFKLLILSISLYFCLFIVMSGVLFIFDIFSLLRIQVLCCIIELIFILTLYLVFDYKKINMYCDLKTNVFPIIFSGIAILFCFNTFDYYGMGQDQGGYQAKAIDFVYDRNENQIDFEEYWKLPDRFQKEFEEKIKTIPGLYNYDLSYPTMSETARKSPVSAIYHGIQTFPAILALWGDIFGVSNIQGIQILFLICCIFILNYILVNIMAKNSTIILGLSLFTFSPMIIWVTRSALTELLFALFILMFIFYLTDRQNINKKYLSAIPIISLSFFHISIFTIIPMIAFIYIIMYILTKERQYIIINIIMSFGFMIGFTSMFYISPEYTYGNISRMYIGNIITKDNIKYLGIIMGLVIILTCIFLNFIRNIKFREKFNINKILLFSLTTAIISSLFIIGINFYKISFGFSEAEIPNLSLYYGEGLKQTFSHISLISYMYSTSILILPIILIYLLVKPSFMLKSNENFLFSVMFVYCILLLSAFFRKEVQYYYYYSRYLVPYISVIVIIGAVILNKFSNKLNYLLITISLLVMFPFNYSLITSKDDSNMSYNTLLDLKNHVEDNSALIVYDLDKYFLPMKSMTKADIYPVFDDFNYEVELLSQKYKNIYFIGQDDYVSDRFSTVYKNTYIKSNNDNVKEESNNIIKLPLNFQKQNENVSLLKYNSYQYEYNVGEKYVQTAGFYPSYGDYPTWSYVEEPKIKCYLPKKDYILNINFGTQIPYEKLNLTEYDIGVYVNSNFVTNLILNKDDYTKKIMINKEFLKDGENEIIFKSNLWSPDDYGIDNDQRKFGFPIKSINFFDVNTVFVGLSDFYTQVGEKVNDGFKSNGKEGLLIYGPYKSMNVGTYKIEINGKISNKSDENIGWMDIAGNKGTSTIINKIDIKDFQNGEEINLIKNFTLGNDVNDIEFRVYVEKGVYLELNQLKVTKLN